MQRWECKAPAKGPWLRGLAGHGWRVWSWPHPSTLGGEEHCGQGVQMDSPVRAEFPAAVPDLRLGTWGDTLEL